MPEKTSITDTVTYREVCKKASLGDVEFDLFKKNNVYCGVLEHASVQEANEGIKEIKSILGKHTLDFIKKASVNDKYGGATRARFKFDEGDIHVSPSTIRYCTVAAKIKNLFGNTKDMKICEIGGGYGGQCAVISSTFGFHEYHIVDLEEPGMLQKRYLDTIGIKNHKEILCHSLEDISKKYDLLISNYAFSECSAPVQKIYMDKILSRSTHGYMIMNFLWKGISEKEFKKCIPKLKIYPEIPNTSPNNVLYTW
jgi:hypothetical protein